jgi:hypothetical protein
MKFVAWLLGLAIFSGLTGGAYMASTAGWGLSGMLDKPVSIRQQSTTGRRHMGGPMFLYFGSRRHHGGGWRGGK